MSECVGRLRQTLGKQLIGAWLFGSKARGDFGTDSDLDVLVLAIHDNWKFRQAISFLAADVSLAYDLVLAPKVISLARWEFLNQEGFAIVRNVRQEGVIVAGVPA